MQLSSNNRQEKETYRTTDTVVIKHRRDGKSFQGDKKDQEFQQGETI